MDDFLDELFFESVAVMKRNEMFAMITLVNKTRDRQINIITDNSIREQLLLRLKGEVDTKKLLPEVFNALLSDMTAKGEYKILIQTVVNGEYVTEIYNTLLGISHRIRISDAILMSIVTDIPIYIKRKLLEIQGTKFDESDRYSTALPINTMPIEALEDSLENCISNEDFELASKLAEEIEKRKKKKKEQEGS